MRIGLAFLLFVACVVAKGQKARVEVAMMDCIYKSQDDNGTAFKESILIYEKLLIREGFLKNGKGKSYRELLQKIVESKKDYERPSVFFDDGLFDTSRENVFNGSTCDEHYLTNLENFEVSTFTNLTESVADLVYRQTLSIKSVSQMFLDNLSVGDFNLLYYKVQVFKLLSLFDLSSGIKAFEYVREGNENVDLERYALSILLNESSNLEVNERVVTMDQLEGLVKNHVRKYGPSSSFIFTSSGKAEYSVYENTMQIIRSCVIELRETESVELFGIPYKELDDEQKETLQILYPFNISERNAKN